MEIDNIFASKKGNDKYILKNLFSTQSSDDSDSDCSSNDEKPGANNGEDPNPDNDGTVNSDPQQGAQYSVFTVQSVDVKTKERKELGIAHQIWPAARFLCDYIVSNPNVILEHASDSLNIIELGAGLGLCGIFVALLFKNKFSSGTMKVVVTDLPEAIEGLNDNIDINSDTLARRIVDEAVNGDDDSPQLTGLPNESVVESAVLSWGNEEDLLNVMSKFSHGTKPLVLAADCIYWECLFAPLFETVNALVKTHGCEIVVCQIKRWKKEQKFFAICRKNHLVVETIIEKIDYIPCEDTGVLKKQIFRIFRIYV